MLSFILPLRIITIDNFLLKRSLKITKHARRQVRPTRPGTIWSPLTMPIIVPLDIKRGNILNPAIEFKAKFAFQKHLHPVSSEPRNTTLPSQFGILDKAVPTAENPYQWLNSLLPYNGGLYLPCREYDCFIRMRMSNQQRLYLSMGSTMISYHRNWVHFTQRVANLHSCVEVVSSR